MVPIKEALTFDDVTLAPKYSEVLPSEVDTKTSLSKSLGLKLISRLTRQLQGTLSYKYENGAVFTLTFKDLFMRKQIR